MVFLQTDVSAGMVEHDCLSMLKRVYTEWPIKVCPNFEYMKFK